MSQSSLQVLAGAVQALSPQQTKFNTLMQRIEQQRELLREWEAATALFHQRYMAEIVPLRQQDLALKEQLLRLFDRLSDQKLAKADQTHLNLLICHYIDEVLASVQDKAKTAELKAIYNRHAEIDEAKQQPSLQHDKAQQMDGLHSDGNGQASPEELLAQFQQAADEQEARHQAAEAARASGKAQRQDAAKARKQQEADKEASQSVRAVYRKLASSLHPDREPDPAERERKTALMQRANQAYAAGQLLQLLELQLEVEQIDAKHMAGLSNERLKHYNQVLKEQLREIKLEVASIENSFKASFGLSPSEKLAPKKLRPMLASEVAARKHNLTVLGMQLKVFSQDTSEFKAWLKDSRQFDRE